MVRSAILAIVALWEAGCAPTRPSPARLAAERACPSAPPANWHTFAPESAMVMAPRLVGTYELVTVATTRGMEGGPRRVPMRLAVTDSAERTRVPGFGPDGRQLRLWDQPVTAYIGIPNETPAVQPPYVYRLRAGPFVQDERHLCNDCGATMFWLQAIGPSGFWGQWESYLGGIKVQGGDGKFHETIGGRFCAGRTTSDTVPREGRVR